MERLRTNLPVTAETAAELLDTIIVERTTIDCIARDRRYPLNSAYNLYSTACCFAETTLKNAVQGRKEQIQQLREMLDLLETSYDNLSQIIIEEEIKDGVNIEEEDDDLF